MGVPVEVLINCVSKKLCLLTSLTLVVLIFRASFSFSLSDLGDLKSMKQHFDILMWSLFTSIYRFSGLRTLLAFS